MFNDERQSIRSPTLSRTGSYVDGPVPRSNGRAYQSRSSITEETAREDNEYEEAPYEVDESTRNIRPPQQSEDPYISALRHRFPNRPKNDYSYSKPTGPSIPAAPILPSTIQPAATTTAGTTPRSGPYQSITRPATGGTNASDTSEGRTFQRPALRPVNPEQQNTYARRITGDPPPPPTTRTTPLAPPPPPPLPTSTYPSRPTTSGPTVRINEPDIQRNRPPIVPPAYNSQSGGPPGPHESIFEKVAGYGGPVSYLGIGTFSQFEHCLHECLERERHLTGMASQITRQDIPTHLPVIDHDYNPVSIPYYHGLDPARVHQFIDYPSRPTATYALDDIRQINVALSRSGIPLLPYHRPYHDSYFSPICSSPRFYSNERHASGAVVSACQVVEDDPAIMSGRDGIDAVQNVWNAIQTHRPFPFSRGPYDI